MDKLQTLVELLDGPTPSAVAAVDLLLRMNCDLASITVVWSAPDALIVRVGNDPELVLRPCSRGAFRSGLARVATICCHAPLLRSKRLSPPILSSPKYLINVDPDGPIYFRASATGGTIYECFAVIAVSRADKDQLLQIEVINRTDSQRFRGTAVARAY